MKKIVFLALSVLALVACSSDSKVSEPEPLTIQWSLSGTFGGSVLDSLRSDMNLTGKTFVIEIPHWEQSLKQCLFKLA